jgi:hypothetical protein
MKRESLAVIIGVLTSGILFAQAPPPPRTLPPSLEGQIRDKPTAPLSPAEAAKQREATIKALKEDLKAFDPDGATARLIEGRWWVISGKSVLKDFGTDRTSALDAVRVIQDLRFNQFGTIAGSNPPFEYWVADGKAARGINTRVTILPISARMIRAEQVGGTWVLTDGVKGLYDFGADADAAKRAAVVFWKYGFNQIGIIGAPRPTMIFPLLDPRQANLDKAAPLPQQSPVGVYQDLQRTSLLLPGNVYGGPKSPLDVSKLKPVRLPKGDWALMQGDDILGRFGSSETTAIAAMKALQEARPTEVVRIGDCGWPLFLANGQPIHGEPLTATKTSLRADRLKVTKVRETYWIFDDIRPVTEVGSKADAELVLGIIRYFDLKNVSFFGRPETGGLRLLTAGR